MSLLTTHTKKEGLALLALVCLSLSLPMPAPARTWTFQQLLTPPTSDELDHFDHEWVAKSWEVGDTALVATASVPVGADSFEARLYNYTLNGSQRCGAVLLPPGAKEGSLAGLVDIGDIRWDYPDRDLTRGAYVTRILGDRARDFALIVPCARGQGLRIGEAFVHAEGDRRDAWVGVAEDAMSFLTAALAVIPQIDPGRVGVYGYSRGGGVSLIVGERDSRIRCVLDFAGPTDWFAAMGRQGSDWAATLEKAAGNPNLRPDTRESQFLDFFVRDREDLPLSELRQRLVGASPLYFADRLPACQVHQGAEDHPVPARNAIALRKRWPAGDGERQVFVYPGSGHLLDGTGGFVTARAFLVEKLVDTP